MSLIIASQREIAQRLGLSVGTVRKLIRAKLLPAHLVRGVYVLPPGLAVLSAADLLALALRGPSLASASNPHASPAGVSESLLGTGLAEVSAHSASECPLPGGGVGIETSAPGPSPASAAKHRDKYGYVVEIKRKKGTGPKRVVRLRAEGEGVKGGRGRTKKRMLHPVIQEMVDGTL